MERTKFRKAPALFLKEKCSRYHDIYLPVGPRYYGVILREIMHLRADSLRDNHTTKNGSRFTPCSRHTQCKTDYGVDSNDGAAQS